MDKVIFLLNKDEYAKKFVENLTREQLENCANSDGYDDDETFVKIDANNYSSVDDAVFKEGFFLEDWYVRAFGFDNDNTNFSIKGEPKKGKIYENKEEEIVLKYDPNTQIIFRYDEGEKTDFFDCNDCADWEEVKTECFHKWGIIF